MSAISIQDRQHPLIGRLANRILEIWEAHLELSPYRLPEDLGYIEGKLEGERLTIENRCFQTPQFRKLHLELARVGESLEILHCVMFPKPSYDLPVFGCDLVGGRGQISAAIADLSPVEAQLPAEYQSQLNPWLKRQAAFSQQRQLPQWGNIFSPYCLFVRPIGPGEEQLFLDATTAYLEFHCGRASASQPVDREQQANIVAGQQRYCDRQQQNDKTRRVLEKAFGKQWTDRYISTVLFDSPDPAPQSQSSPRSTP
ncbi:phycocyanobilin:ferredoxin oxidoreductase [Synechococcus sp. PCC 7336]|uniref:phycocyanobilin:ferredoxin oxidoreductase n=1 Tax=Synechococcus sp. PCC 7336 TaxID=195250 RepID=UPI00034543C5|nr:phycocyanobilin:ferredoxin oxidoreductase [Synechococcus sp. PCC 7336]